jgi:hypothetical protein
LTRITKTWACSRCNLTDGGWRDTQFVNSCIVDEWFEWSQ